MQLVDTALKGSSIWDTVGQSTFRENIKKLMKSSDNVPKDPRVYAKEDWLNCGDQEGSFTFPFEVERQLADDIAFIAASQEGGRRVSAVAVEEIDGRGLVIRLAANRGVPEAVSKGLEEIFAVLQQCANEGMQKPGSKGSFKLSLPLRAPVQSFPGGDVQPGYSNLL